jgi:flagellar hook assembly protein FlgD
MKKALTVVAVLFSLCIGVSYADVFASGYKVTNPDGTPFDGKFTDGTGVKVWYYLNDTATAVVVRVINASNGSTAATINAGAQGVSSNPNSVEWDGATAVNGGKYYFSVETTGPVGSETGYSITKFVATSLTGKNIYTRGVDANIYMNTRGFGNIYAVNSDNSSNDRLRTGVLRFNADASYNGTEAGNPMLMSSLGTTNGGTMDWSGLAPWYSTVCADGEIVMSGNGDSGKVYIMKNDSAAPKAFLSGIVNPRGLAVTGTGANKKIYIAADTAVWRADIGDNDTLMTPPVLVLDLGIYVRDVIVDDDGHLIVALRDTPAGVAPGYIERYDVSSGLPKTRANAEWSQPFVTGQPVGLGLIHGPDRNSVSDDTLYVSMRGGTSSDNATIGIWQATDLGGFITFNQIFYPDSVASSAGGNISANADLTVDYAGNIVFFENGNEEIFMFTPPHAGGINTEVTQTYDTITVSNSLSVSAGSMVPGQFTVNQNYPNPFNPSTMISYTMPDAGSVTIDVYDVLGHRVKEVYNGTSQQGYNAVVWNATNSFGVKVSSGVYIYKVTAQLGDGRTLTDVKRMMLLK